MATRGDAGMTRREATVTELATVIEYLIYLHCHLLEKGDPLILLTFCGPPAGVYPPGQARGRL